MVGYILLLGTMNINEGRLRYAGGTPKNQLTKKSEKNPAERSAFSESPGRETPILKI